MGVSTTTRGGGRLDISLSAGTAALLPSNALQQVRFGAATNALIDVGDYRRMTGNFTYTPPSGTTQVSAEIRPVDNKQAVTVPLVVVDRCGDWPTVVGTGAAAP